MADTVDNLFRKFLASNIREALSSIPKKGEISKEKIKVARKAIKKVRTILRLLSSSLKTGWVKTEEEILKDISKQFKGLRNIFIAEEIFKEIIPLLKKEKLDCDPSEILKLFESLEKESFASFQSDEKKRKSIIVDLQVAYERLDEMLFKASPWDPILEEVVGTYKECHKLFKSLSKNPSDSDIIDFRKSLNFLNIELHFLSPYLLSSAKTHAKSVENLSQRSGHTQDIVQMAQLLKDNKKHLSSSDNLKTVLSFLDSYKEKTMDQLKAEAKEVFQALPKEYLSFVFDLEKVKAEKNSFKEKKSFPF